LPLSGASGLSLHRMLAGAFRKARWTKWRCLAARMCPIQNGPFVLPGRQRQGKRIKISINVRAAFAATSTAPARFQANAGLDMGADFRREDTTGNLAMSHNKTPCSGPPGSEHGVSHYRQMPLRNDHNYLLPPLPGGSTMAYFPPLPPPESDSSSLSVNSKPASSSWSAAWSTIRFFPFFSTGSIVAFSLELRFDLPSSTRKEGLLSGEQY